MGGAIWHCLGLLVFGRRGRRSARFACRYRSAPRTELIPLSNPGRGTGIPRSSGLDANHQGEGCQMSPRRAMFWPLSYDGGAVTPESPSTGMSKKVTTTFIRASVGSFTTESPATAPLVVEALPPFAPFKGCTASEEGR